MEAAEIVNRFVSEGLLVNREALDLLRGSATKEIYEKTVANAIRMAREEKASMVEARHVLAAISMSKGEAIEAGRRTRMPLAKEVDPEVELLYSPPETVLVSDSVESRVRYFRSRFQRLESLLRARPDFRSPVPISEISRSSSQGPFKTIVMVAKKENRRILVEDLDDSATVTMPKRSSPELEGKFSYLVVDMVVGLEVRKFQDLLLVTDVVLPDVPDTPTRRTRSPISTLLLSDLHVGSKHFLSKQFSALTDWLSGTKGTITSQQVANSVKYVIVAGDIVDGVFVYPKQERELEIVSVDRQYEQAVEALAKIPDYVYLVIGPGNHDIVRDAIPQPPIPKDLLDQLVSDRGNTIVVGNPTQLSLHKVRFLVYHGQSLEDIASSVPSIDYSTPQEGMRFLLRARHLAPIYGGNTQICVEGEDDLAIMTKPDVFHTGHVHVSGFTSYRGTQMVNSGTWQETTTYQANLGIRPTPTTFGVYLMKEGRTSMLTLDNVV